VVATSLGFVSAKDANQISITWSAVTGATSYNVYHTWGATGGSGPTKGGSTTYETSSPITSTSYTFTVGTTVLSADYFEFAVSAVNTAGEGGLSSIQKVQVGGSALGNVGSVTVQKIGGKR
jgi:hypothetical protein